MIRKTLSLLLALSLLLTLLSACQSSSDPAALPDPQFSVLELAEAVSNAAADAPDAPERFDSGSPELLDTYIEAAYGLSGGRWEEGAVVTATGVQAYEIAVLRFSDEAAAEHGAACLEQYLTAREGAFFGYAPEQAALVSNAVVCREGLYAGLFICEDSAAARDLFVSILTTGVLPEPAPVPEPEPEPEEPVDMMRLMAGVIESCIDEINEMGGITYTSSFRDYTAGYFYQRAAENFGIETNLEGGFFVDKGVSAGEAFCLYVLCMTDEAAAGQALEALRQYRDSQETAGLELQKGRYAAQFVGADPEAMAAAFEAELERLEAEQFPEPAAEPQPVINREGLVALKDRLSALCRDDVGAADLITLSINDRNAISSTYGITEDQWEAAFTVEGEFEVDLDSGNNGIKSYTFQGPDGDAFELTVLCMTDEAAAIRNAATLQLRVWSTLWTLKTGVYGIFDPPETVNVDSRVVRDGRYLALFICRDPEAVEAEFEAALSELLSTHGNGEPTPHGTAEAPLFRDVNWDEPEGDSDPDYPGRLLYKPVEDEHMTLYDTSATLAAWEKRDPSGLSEYDRAIYDSAEEVLGEFLRGGMSDLEKEIAIYDWVLQNLEYDWRHQDSLEETPETSYTPYGGLVEHMGVCLGYASTFELLMDMAGIECVTVIGASMGSEEAHAWNMVRLDGEWYFADPTWDNYNPRWEWDFFNVTTEYMVRTNHQWDYASTPEATAADHGQR